MNSILDQARHEGYTNACRNIKSIDEAIIISAENRGYELARNFYTHQLRLASMGAFTIGMIVTICLYEYLLPATP